MSMDNVKAALTDERVAAVAARVARHEGESSHYRVNDEGDLVVSVLTLQHEVPIEANLGALVGGGGKGVWQIPDVGVEVMVAFDDGAFEGEAYVVGYYPSGSSPGGLAPGKIFILGNNVEIRSTGGSAQAVAYKADVEDVISKLNSLISLFNAHTHLHGPYSPIGGPAVPTAVPASLATPALPSDGTSVLKAE